MLLVRTIAIINQKGGVGKTTSVTNLSAAIAAAGYATCVIDMDPQAHLTLSLGVEPDTNIQGTYHILTGDTTIEQALRPVQENLHMVASSIDLAAAEVELVGTVGREQILRDRVAELTRPFDFILIDCPPSLGLLTLNALAAADDVIIPLQPHFLALQGLGKLLETVALVQRRINSKLRVSGVMLCMYETSTRLAGEVLADLRNFFESARGTSVPWADARIFETVIRRNIKLAECPSYGRDIFRYEPSSNGASDYAGLAMEFLESYGKSATLDVASAAAQQGVIDAPPEAPAGEAAPAAPVPTAHHQDAPAENVTDEAAKTPAQ